MSVCTGALVVGYWPFWLSAAISAVVLSLLALRILRASRPLVKVLAVCLVIGGALFGNIVIFQEPACQSALTPKLILVKDFGRPVLSREDASLLFAEYFIEQFGTPEKFTKQIGGPIGNETLFEVGFQSTLNRTLRAITPASDGAYKTVFLTSEYTLTADGVMYRRPSALY